jgi:hypothetical protein
MTIFLESLSFISKVLFYKFLEVFEYELSQVMNTVFPFLTCIRSFTKTQHAYQNNENE